MQLNPTQKYRLVLLGSWLIAKLWGSFELSRLMFFRFFTGNRIVHISRIETPFSRTEWIYEPPQLYGLTFDPEQDQVVLRRVAEIMKS
jgi:hypothetical protein